MSITYIRKLLALQKLYAYYLWEYVPRRLLLNKLSLRVLSYLLPFNLVSWREAVDLATVLKLRLIYEYMLPQCNKNSRSHAPNKQLQFKKIYTEAFPSNNTDTDGLS